MSNNIVNIAKNLRKRPTKAERLLWRHLRGKFLLGFKFRRQHPIGQYVVDFVCLDKQLVVELDGGHHARDKGKDKDIERDNWLKREGFKVLRFWNNEVLENIEGILEVVKNSLFHPPPSPSPQGRGNTNATSSIKRTAGRSKQPFQWRKGRPATSLIIGERK